MKDNKYLAWTSFVLFVVSAGLILFIVLLSSVFSNIIENPGIIILAVGAFSLLAAIMGLMAFKAPQAKVGGIGGLVLLLLVSFILPAGSETTFVPPQPEETGQAQAGPTGMPEIDAIIEIMLAGNPQEELRLLQFSTLACTHAEGLGGPPKCREGEEEGTKIEAFPFLGPEGHHMRQSETDGWTGIRAFAVYAVYRVSERVYSDEDYPAGKYAIVFLIENQQDFVIAHVTDGKIVRLDYIFGGPSAINLEQDAAEIILAPRQ